jgi:hypothetical protein
LADLRQVFFEELATPGDLVIPFEGEAFVALIWGCNVSFDASQRHDVATALIESGCRYVVCGGKDCEAWHDDTDMACAVLEVESSQEIPFVMTTWHTDESVEDVVFFAFNLTNFDEHDFRKYLVLMVGHDPSEQNHIETLIQAESR